MPNWIAIIPQGNQLIRCISLPHPRTGTTALFALNQSNLLEYRKLPSNSQHSWFIKDTVVRNGDLSILFPFNPLYILIPILTKRRQKSIDSKGKLLAIDDLLLSDEYLDLSLLSSLPNLHDQLSLICDIQEISQNEFYYRLNDDMLMHWLEQKVATIVNNYDNYPLMKVLKSTESAIKEDAIPEFRKRQAVLLLADNLDKSTVQMLNTHLNLNEAVSFESKYAYFSQSTPGHPEAKKMAEKAVEKETKKPDLSHGQKKLAKANIKGMKSLSSFFAKKE